MSTDLIKSIQNQVMSMPDGGVDEDTRAVAGNAQNKRLSIKGAVFRKFINGKEAAAIEERHMNVIFVKMAHTPSRNFYSKPFKEGEVVAPDCWSSDTQTPDTSVKTPLAKTCQDCSKSIAGSGNDGQGTACRLSWRTAVVLPNDPAGDILQLVLPATSVFGKQEGDKWPFRAYIQMLASNNISAGRVITKMSFDTKVSQPKLLFQPVSAVPPEDVVTVQEQSKTTEAELAVKIIAFTKRADKKEEGEAPPAALPPGQKNYGTEAHPVSVPPPSAIPEPVLRGADKETPAPTPDIADIVKKWSTKK